ncbi:MAG: PEP-CTERM sorting domain-containing protein [Oscillatoria princeps RMCB-10]|jgi:hypothetical protein|nr:PEP-CTERM sorting domain-containing protein [Oscillatoria princeps RMCB-10]
MAFSSVVKNLAMAAAGAALLALGVPGKAQAGTLIDTTPGWNGSSDITSLGEPNTATYGQTFTVGSDNVLNDFSFWVNDVPSAGPDSTDFAAYVMEWDSANYRAKGDILYQSGMQSTTGAAGMEKFVFNTGGTALTSGKQYVAFLSASKFFDGVRGSSDVGWIGKNVYNGGDFVFSNNGANFSALTSSSWDNWGFQNTDMAFQASFSQASASVPEPSSMLGLLAFGTLGTGSLLKRKHQKAKYSSIHLG